MNIAIYLIILIISMITLYYLYKLLGQLGLMITVISMSTISFILNFKYIMLSTINLNANCITQVTMIIALYLMLNTSNQKETSKVINLNFIINIFTAFMLYIMTCYTQTLTDTISVNMKNVFEANYKILIIYPFTALLTSYLLIWIYNKIKKIYDNHFINAVTIYLLIGLIEGIVYTFLAYASILNVKTIILIILSTYMIKLIITVIYSIILTILAKKKVIS